jgi:heptaprenyl diphosphate synthase
MKHSFLTPDMVKIGWEILEWSKTYLAQEHKQVKRPRGSQVICPFVKPTIDANSYYLTFQSEITEKNVQAIATIALSYIEEFKQLNPNTSKSVYKKALVVVFNNLNAQDACVLDAVHEQVKDAFVASGLMIGQFHPLCEERGAYNPHFKISVSPYPLLAIRSMAVHDILFLKEKRTWFETFDALYGNRFKKEMLDENTSDLEGYYLQAKEKYDYESGLIP